MHRKIIAFVIPCKAWDEQMQVLQKYIRKMPPCLHAMQPLSKYKSTLKNSSKYADDNLYFPLMAPQTILHYSESMG